MKSKKVLLVVFLLASTLMASGSNWKNLFNGKNLDGWKIINGTAEYVVENGVIIGTSKLNTPNTFLATEDMYKNFILEVEVKVDGDLNSGIQFRSNTNPDYKEGKVHGYQAEIDPSARAWSGGIYDEERRGWLYNLECNPEAKVAFNKGAWNKYRVEAIDNNVKIWVNGIQTADIVDEIVEEGFIALQVHSISDEKLVGKTVSFKNVRILTEGFEEERCNCEGKIPQISYLKNELTKREKCEGWKLLWDGKTTKGWRGSNLDTFPGKGWEIEDGCIYVVESGGYESRNGGDIITTEKYKNFELEVDFKLSKGANSGIKYFVQPSLNNGAGSEIGCEYQVLDDEFHPDAKKGVNGNRTLASLYDLIPANALFYAPNENRSKRQNKYGWNRAKIVVKGNHVEHYLNGIKVVEYERSTQLWKAIVAYSKYSKWPNFGEFESGHILLQDHGNEVHYKNIKIKVTD